MRAAAATDPGLQRDVNEDRVHADVARGLFMVIDGMGGQAAGGKAADIALTTLRSRLERPAGSPADRVREAITMANNEIHRVAAQRPEWNGMACVLTAVVVDDGRAIVGHVGDTRLYKLRGAQIEKVTPDHSPVGEREDARELSEREAMRHPRRNEVYRDVGSEHHRPDDPEFIDVIETPLEPDAALLLCSDGLTDLVDSEAIQRIAARASGRPQQVAAALIDAAKAAGGKDNVSVVYVEGDRVAAARSETTRRLNRSGTGQAPPEPNRRAQAVRLAIVILLIVVTGLAAARLWPYRQLLMDLRTAVPATSGRIEVPANGSIADALRRADAGAEVIVEPGEYHETIALKSGVRVVSRVPRGATIRLAGKASEGDPAVVAADVKNTELVGFRIVGDAATPLGAGVVVRHAEVSIVDVEITGAANAAIRIDRESRAWIVGSDIHDNPGAALSIDAGATPRISHNVFARNGMSERVRTSFKIDASADPKFSNNVFQGVSPDAFAHLAERTRAALARDNWFVESTAGRGR